MRVFPGYIFTLADGVFLAVQLYGLTLASWFVLCFDDVLPTTCSLTFRALVYQWKIVFSAAFFSQ